MLANNEIGSIQPIKKLAQIAHQFGAYFHTDAVQGVGHLKIDVKELDVDLLTMSAHKFYGPKGIGALYVKKGVKIEKLIHGGHQELGMRAGTSNVPLAVGMAHALKNTYEKINQTELRCLYLRDRFERNVLSKLENLRINGAQCRLSSISSITIEGLNNTLLLANLDMRGIYCSAGSACSSGSIEPSHVLKAIGLTNESCLSTLRFSFGKSLTEEDVDYAADVFVEVVNELRSSNAIKYIDTSENI